MPTITNTTYYEEYYSSDTIKTRCLAKENIYHTPDEARSVGLAKACVLSNNLFSYREISFKIVMEVILFSFCVMFAAY